MIDVRDLHCLTALAEELQFGRAAQRLGIAQPALTKRIQKIEAELGVRLFVRSSQGVALTVAGADVVAHARDMLGDWRAMRTAADSHRAGTRGLVRIGAVGSAFYEALPSLLAAARSELPDIALKIEEMETPAAVEALRFGQIHVAFVRPPVRHGLEVRTVWLDELAVAVPTGHPLAVQPSASIPQLSGDELVFFRRDAGPGYWDRVAAMFHDADVPFEPTETAEHTSTILGLVALGVGVSIVPGSARRFAMPNVAYVPLRGGHLLSLAVASNPDFSTRATRRLLRTLPVEPVCGAAAHS